jgi:hypothetical protein
MSWILPLIGGEKCVLRESCSGSGRRLGPRLRVGEGLEGGWPSIGRPLGTPQAGPDSDLTRGSQGPSRNTLSSALGQGSNCSRSHRGSKCKGREESWPPEASTSGRALAASIHF